VKPDGVLWKRVMDMNDRALRSLRTAVGKPTERAPAFDITAASEIMAILCLAESLPTCAHGSTASSSASRRRASRSSPRNSASPARCMALLREALQPNLVQSVEGVPAFLHGGPFANIAHGCNSVLATRMALAHADFAVTEAGFAFDLGGEKFMHIKCRQSGLAPAAIVIVATVRALKMHGGAALDQLTQTRHRSTEPRPGKPGRASRQRRAVSASGHRGDQSVHQRP
jgi:formate--tetrahydrofolate ligase